MGKTPSSADKILEPLKTLFYLQKSNPYWILLGIFFGTLSHISRSYRWNYLLNPLGYKITFLKFRKKIDVETITLNSFLLTNKIEEVDFVHMDVQGAELKVLMGAKDYINKIKAVWLEVADIELYKGQPLRVDIQNFMTKNGFYLVKSEMEGQVGDQFYLNKKYFKIFNFFLFFRKIYGLNIRYRTYSKYLE